MKRQIFKSFAMGIAVTAALILISAGLGHSSLGALFGLFLMPILIPVGLLLSAVPKGSSQALMNVVLYSAMLLFGGILFGAVFHLGVQRRRTSDSPK